MTDLTGLNQAAEQFKLATDLFVDEVVRAITVIDDGSQPVPPEPPTTIVQPPRAPITDITNSTGLGLNVVGGKPQSFQDYVSEGTYDSAVLLGPGEGGSSFARFHLEDAASVGTGPGYGRHALYCKGPNVTCTDWYVRMNPKAKDTGSGWSVRFAGFSLDRFDFEGNWFGSLFDDDPNHKAGPAEFKNGTAKFAATSAIWCDCKIPYAVLIENGEFEGPSDLIFDASASSPVTVTIRNCTINGKAATKAAVRGVTASKVTVS